MLTMEYITQAGNYAKLVHLGLPAMTHTRDSPDRGPLNERIKRYTAGFKLLQQDVKHVIVALDILLSRFLKQLCYRFGLTHELIPPIRLSADRCQAYTSGVQTAGAAARAAWPARQSGSGGPRNGRS